MLPHCIECDGMIEFHETNNFGGAARPVAGLLMTGEGRFPQILDLFRGLKISVPRGNLDF